MVFDGRLRRELLDTGINFLQSPESAWFWKEKSGCAKCWSFSNELANVSVLGAVVVSICINDSVRTDTLLFITVLNNLELLMVTEEFCKNTVKVSGQ